MLVSPSASLGITSIALVCSSALPSSLPRKTKAPHTRVSTRSLLGVRGWGLVGPVLVANAPIWIFVPPPTLSGFRPSGFENSSGPIRNEPLRPCRRCKVEYRLVGIEGTDKPHH